MLHDFSGKIRCFQILRLKEEDVDSCNEFGWERHLADGYETWLTWKIFQIFGETHSWSRELLAAAR